MRCSITNRQRQHQDQHQHPAINQRNAPLSKIPIDSLRNRHATYIEVRLAMQKLFNFGILSSFDALRWDLEEVFQGVRLGLV